MSKVLKRAVSGMTPEGVAFSYLPGMPANKMDDGVAEYITNPKAWEDRAIEDEDFITIPEGMTKEQFIAAAKATMNLDPDAPTQGDVEDELSDMKIPELREYATEYSIDLGDATKKADILDAIRRHEAGTEGEGAGNS
jgi:hypothetical protein